MTQIELNSRQKAMRLKSEQIHGKQLCSDVIIEIARKAQLTQRGNVQQRCVFEGLVQTKSELTHPSNDVSFTLARGRQMARPVSLSHIDLKSQVFLTPSHLVPR